MFDFQNVAIGGVALAYLLPGLIEFFKSLGLTGKRNIWIMAFVLAMLFGGIALSINEGLIPDVMMPYIRVAIGMLACGVGACSSIGGYEIKRKFSGS